MPLLCAMVLLSAFVVVTSMREPGSTRSFDQQAVQLADSSVHGPLKWFVNRWETLGRPEVSILLTVLLAGTLAARGKWMTAGLVVGGFLVVAAVEGALRVRIQALPWPDLSSVLAHPRGRHLADSTYPSGHTARLMLLAGLAVGWLPRRLVPAGVLVALLGGVLMGAQRVHARVHTGSDVLGGLLLGAGVAALCVALLPWAARMEPRIAAWLHRARRSWPGVHQGPF